MQKTWVQFLGWEDLLEKKMQPITVVLPGKSHEQRSLVGYSSWSHERVGHDLATKQDFPGGSDSKDSACNVGDLGSIPGLGRSPGEGKGYPLRYSGLENSMDTVHGVTKSQTRLSDFHFQHVISGLQIWTWETTIYR